jgi:hypothetical protein
MDLGFKRKEMNDSIFIKKNGYQWFIVTMKLNKGIVAEWCCENRTVELVRYKKSDVLQRMPVKSLDELKKYVEFFTQKSKT